MVGHGGRERGVWGPPAPEDTGQSCVVAQRRYRCRACGAVVVVRPQGLIGRLRYAATAVAMALRLWGREQLAGPAVRDRISPLPSGLYTRLHGWRQLPRWVRAAHRLWPGVRETVGTVRERAAACVSQLAAHTVLVGVDFVLQVWDGAQRA